MKLCKFETREHEGETWLFLAHGTELYARKISGLYELEQIYERANMDQYDLETYPVSKEAAIKKYKEIIG